MNTTVLLVEPQTAFRAQLTEALRARGGEVELYDDPMQALARADSIAASVVAVGPASDERSQVAASALIRMLERRDRSRVYRLGLLGLHTSGLPSRAAALSRAAGAEAIASALLGEQPAGIATDAVDMDVGAAQLGQALMWLLARRATGVLTITGDGLEREVALAWGMPVATRSTLPQERLGALAVRSGAVQAPALERALRLSRARGLRIGEALVELGAIDGSALFRLRAQQTQEQLEAAVAGGPYKARFSPQTDMHEHCELYPCHPLTALAGSAMRLPAQVVSAALERAAGRPVVERNLVEDGARWLDARSITLDPSANTLGALRTTLGQQPAAGALRHDAMLLALMGGGVLRLGEVERAARAAPSLPPPVGSSMLRTLDARAPWKPPQPSAAAVSGAFDDKQACYERFLVGTGAYFARRTDAPAGPAGEALSDELRGLYARLRVATDPLRILGVAPHASSPAIDLAYCALLANLDDAAQRSASETAELRKLELRSVIDRAYAVLIASAPTKSAEGSSVPAPGDAIAAAQGRPAAMSAELSAELDPLVSHARWHDIANLIEARFPGNSEMPAGAALLYAVALKEAPATAERAAAIAQAERSAMRATGDLLGVQAESALALVMSKRLLRKRPLEWQKTPPKRVSVMLMLAALIVGAAVGLALSHQSLPLPF